MLDERILKMKSISITRWFLAGSLLLIPAVSAIAQEAPAPGNAQGQGQPQRGQRGGRGGQLSLISVPVSALKSGLKLTDDQAKKIEEIQKKTRADLRALRQPGQQQTPEDFQKMRELNTKATKEIEALLNDEQKKAAPALVKEFSSFALVGLPITILESLKLTDDQKKKILEIADKTQKEMAALTPEERRQKGRELRQSSREEASKLLTDDQKKILEKAQQEAQQRRQRNNNNGN